MDFGSINNCMSDQQKLSLSAASLSAITGGGLTYDDINNKMNQFENMLNGVTGCTIHFPAAVQAKIETMKGYPDFGGTNTTVLFDL